VEHRHAMNFLHGMVQTWELGAADAVLQFSSFTFDVSVLDTFAPLVAGAQVVLADDATRHSPPRLAALIRDRGVTVACLAPAVLSLLSGEEFGDLRVLMSAGRSCRRTWPGAGSGRACGWSTGTARPRRPSCPPGKTWTPASRRRRSAGRPGRTTRPTCWTRT